jgi:hypothetical protein
MSLKKKISIFFFLFATLFLSNAVHAAKLGVEFPRNDSKNMSDVHQFYKTLRENEYREFNNATINVRKKLLYKDLNTMNNYMGPYHEKKFVDDATHIDPHRIVYFLATIKETKQKTYRKYVIYDAQTKTLFEKGDGWRGEKPKK